jgi:nucleoside phosphorylase
MELSPQKVIMVGIAFGIDEKRQQLGTILVSTSIMPYDFKRIGTIKSPDGKKCRAEHIFRSEPVHCPRNILGQFKAVREKWNNCSRPHPTVEFGCILSGQTLIDNLAFRNFLVRKLRTIVGCEIVGGEMEGAGMTAAAQAIPTDWIIVKAICDWGDGNKSVEKEKRQMSAVGNAVKLVFDVLDTII